VVDLHGAGKSLHPYKTYLHTKQATGLILCCLRSQLEFVTLSTSRRLSGELTTASSTSIESRVSLRGRKLCSLLQSNEGFYFRMLAGGGPDTDIGLRRQRNQWR